MNADPDRDVEEIPIDVPDEHDPPGEGELDPDDDYVEGTTREWIESLPDEERPPAFQDPDSAPAATCPKCGKPLHVRREGANVTVQACPRIHPGDH
jgi:hypothetical protein